jgi:aspartyl-tRNA(Asn)/glutamyl-tRNA(Gln) amidotransferase subunit C
MNNEKTLHFAKLARIGLATEEVAPLAQHLNKLMTLIEEMQQVNTKDVDPLSHPSLTFDLRMREDIVTEKNERDAFLKLAPDSQAGLYLVPKVLEEVGDN